MKSDENIKHYTAAELRAKRAQSRTDLEKLDAMSDAELERRIAEDAGEQDMCLDWRRAKLVMPEPKQSVHLRLEREVVEFFRSQGKGHISKMQAVLKAYVEAHRPRAK